jgi:two-component system sensor histidine kinase KdpD
MLERTIRVEERPMLALGVVTAVMSTAAFDFFHVPPVGSFVPAPPRGPAALAILLSVGLLLSFAAAPARSRAIEADERRGEADVAAEIARRLLRADDLRLALPGASARLARALGLSTAAIGLGRPSAASVAWRSALHDRGTVRHAAGSRRPAADDGAARAGAGGGVG